MASQEPGSERTELARVAANESQGPSNGSHEAPVSAPERESRAPAPVREYHAEPREPGPAHEPTPLAHFEPSPRPEGAAADTKPYVVWTSAPVEKVPGGRGPEE
jgi:hypothetical protein